MPGLPLAEPPTFPGFPGQGILGNVLDRPANTRDYKQNPESQMCGLPHIFN